MLSLAHMALWHVLTDLDDDPEAYDPRLPAPVSEAAVEPLVDADAA
jgi:hypothetical protein